MSENQDMTALPSPCISVCQLDAVSGQCLGCYRTSAEIAAWRSMSAKAQGELVEALHQRRAEATGVKRTPTRRRRA